MASLLHLLFIFLITLLLISPTISHNSSTDLPYLHSSLHWTYNSTNSTLSIVFTAPLPSSNGWISWGINPIAPAMIGTEALIAFKAPNGSMIVKTYNLDSYTSVIQTDKLSFKLLDSKAVYSNGVMKILATLVLPANTITVNQVWQVGPAVKDGRPMMHKFDPDNLKSKGTLSLVTSSVDDRKNSPAPAPAPVVGDGKTGGSSRIWSKEASFYVFVMFLGVIFL